MDSTLPESYKAVIAKRDGTRGEIRDVPLQKPGKNEILIKVIYAPINPSDVGTLQGFYPVYPPGKAIPERTECGTGLEGCGVVVAVGEDCLVKHEVGTRVTFVMLGSWSQYIAVPSERAVPSESSLTDEEAACNANAITCVLMHRLAVSGGHKCIIQNAASSTLGRQVIKYFKLKGVKTINIVRKNEYIEELTNLGGDYVLNQEADTFGEKLLELAQKEQATLGFDCIGGDHLGNILYCMPPNSEVRLLGAFSGKPIVAGLQDLLFLNKTIKGFWVTKEIENFNADQFQEILKEVQPYMGGILKSETAKIYPLSEYMDALKNYKDFSSKGKILLKP
jgi:NADPH:quinone reductase